MNPVPLEAYLAKLYTDPVARRAFLADPVRAARDAGIASEDVMALSDSDRVGMKMAAASYANKRELHRQPKVKVSDAWLRWFKR